VKDSAFENFSEGVMEAVHDFARCQRADGSYYGTSGQCKKGSPAGAKEKEAKAPKKAVPRDSNTKSAAAKEQLRQINTQEGRGGGAGRAPTAKDVKALDKAAKAADKKADAADKKFQKSKSPADQKAAKAADKEAKAANKAADKADKAFQKTAKSKKLSPTQEARLSKDPTVQSRIVKSDIQKLSKEYEKLRGKPEAAARRSAIMKEVSSLVKKQASLLKKQGPAKAPDTSPAANRLRANAAARAKD
jgi:hypothetical protein